MKLVQNIIDWFDTYDIRLQILGKVEIVVAADLTALGLGARLEGRAGGLFIDIGPVTVTVLKV